MAWSAKTVPFTKTTDFVGEIGIPSILGTDVIDTGNAAELVRLITKYEKRMLVKLLTQTVYDDFVVAMTGSSTPDAKWTTLYDKLFTEKIPANYIFYWYHRDRATMYGTDGEVKPNQENATNDSAGVKVARAWNENWDLILDFDEWYDTQQSVYGFERTESDILSGWFGYLGEFQPINIFGI